MDRMLVVVFPNEGKAYEGKRALQQLDSEGQADRDRDTQVQTTPGRQERRGGSASLWG